MLERLREQKQVREYFFIITVIYKPLHPNYSI